MKQTQGAEVKKEIHYEINGTNFAMCIYKRMKGENTFFIAIKL